MQESADRLSSRVLSLVQTLALGWAIVSFTASSLGVLGWLNAWSVAALLVPLSVFGWWRSLPERRFRRFAQELRGAWRRLLPMDRKLMKVVSIPLGVLILHTINGSLLPEFQHDALSYHLSVAQRWAHTGVSAMYPSNINSLLTLAVEASYAVVMLYANGTLCTVIYTELTFMMLAGIAVLVIRYSTVFSCILFLATVVPLFAMSRLTVPVETKNDNIVTLWLFSGVVILFQTLDQKRVDFKELGLAGFFLGMAATGKIIAGAFATPIVLCVMFSTVRNVGWKKAFPPLAILVLFGIFAYLPWGVRGFYYSISPIFPIGARVFTPNAPLQHAVNEALVLYGFYPKTLEGLRFALTEDLPYKFSILFTNQNILISLFPLLFLATFFKRGTLWSTIRITLIWWAFLFLWMSGGRIIRFGFIGLPIVGPVMGLMFDKLLGLRPKLRMIVFVSLLLACFGSYARWTIVWANQDAVRWPFHPILLRQQVLEYAQKTESRQLHVGFILAQDYLPEKATVLAPQSGYPYHLHRNVIIPENTAVWESDNPQDEYRKLVEQQIDYVLYEHWAARYPITDSLVEGGFLVEIPVPDFPEGFRLFRVEIVGKPN